MTRYELLIVGVYVEAATCLRQPYARYEYCESESEEEAIANTELHEGEHITRVAIIGRKGSQ